MGSERITKENTIRGSSVIPQGHDMLLIESIANGRERDACRFPLAGFNLGT
jgi:hypothetical protein